MTLTDLVTLLERTGYPVAYYHFVATEENPIPNPPYITYLEAPSSNFFADNKVYRKGINVRVELYTDYKDLEAESKLESIFNENEIPYETDETWIETEKLFERIYEISIN